MMLRYSDKKGSIVDPIMLGGYLLVIFITIYISLYFWVNFQDTMELTIAGSEVNDLLVNVMNELRTTYFYLDYLIPVLVGALMILSFILAYRTGASGIMAPWALLVWAIAMLISAIYTNVYIEFSSQFPAIYTEVPFMNYFMENMKWVVLFWLFVITIVTFRKNTKESNINAGAAMREGII